MAKRFSFSSVPTIKHSRSKLDLSHTVKSSGNLGVLYPFYIQEVYPGDTFKVKSNIVARVSTSFLKPVMDNAFIDMYYFFVPNRLTFDKWVEVMGENNESAWARQTQVDVPSTVSPGTVSPGSLADYFGLPVGSVPAGINILPFRAYALIYNEWFRDQNNIDPVHVQKGDIVSSETFNNNDFSPNNYFGKPAKIAKLHDYFTSCLPAPQKGNSVPITLGTQAPVLFPSQAGGLETNSNFLLAQPSDTWHLNSSTTHTTMSLLRSDSGNFPLAATSTLGVSGSSTPSSVGNMVYEPSTAHSATVNGVLPYNLGVPVNGAYADLSDAQNVFNVNDLRYAFQLQKLLERDARGGTRYVEFLQSHFGVTSPDSRLQRTEFLGGRRIPVNVQQVAQTSQPSTESPLGAVGAYSLSNGQGRMTKGFVEHGFIIGVMAVRQFHTYQQGIERFWQRTSRYDYFDPVFSNIGEQPVWQSEIYALGKTDLKDQPFGYNEAWADLRYRPSRVTGQMRSDATDSFDIWHFADNYTNAPTLSEQFINETSTFFDRTLSAPSDSVDNFIFDIYNYIIAYRPMPTYSVPSLIDHN